MRFLSVPLCIIIVFLCGCTKENAVLTAKTSGNPVFEGWYADPEGAVFGSEYWIFPTWSADYKEQVFLDAFSSTDLVAWEKHPSIIDTSRVSWANKSMWAPAIIEKDRMYYLFFSANDVQRPGGPAWDENDTSSHSGGIGIGVSDSPGGPFRDYLGKPLISDFHNDAQPIDQFVFKDTDGTYYMIYGGWGRCNQAILNDDFTGFVPWDDGTVFREITPEGYVEGPVMFLRKGIYYFMWSEGGWGDPSYKVAYAMAKSVTGPFERIGTILQSDEDIATGAGHNSVINTPGTETWYIVYHRRPIPNEGRDHRVTCIDTLAFNDDGTIRQVRMTFEGVAANPIR